MTNKKERSSSAAFDMLRGAMKMKTLAEIPATFTKQSKIQVTIPRVPPVFTDDERYQFARLCEVLLNMHDLTVDEFLVISSQPLTWYGFVTQKKNDDSTGTVYTMDLFDFGRETCSNPTMQRQIVRLIVLILRMFGISSDAFVEILKYSRL